MKGITKIFLMIFIFNLYNLAQGKMMSTEKLKSQIVDILKKTKGEFAVAFHNLHDPSQQILINEKAVFHAASTMKTPVMIEIFKKADEGLFELKDSILVENKFKSIVDGSEYSMDIDRDTGDELYGYIGKMRTIKQLTCAMITVSSNLATNILIELVGADEVMKTMRSIDAMDIEVLRGVEDMKAYEKGLNNTVTAFDLMLIYEAIADKKIVNEKACEAMIDILLDQKLNYIIPARLPNDVKVAHKTGSIDGIEHDSGIVFLPDGRSYVLVFLSKDLNDNKAGIKAGAKISEMIYKFMADQNDK